MIMSKKIGFIGCGNMGSAMLSGILESGKCIKEDIMISVKSEASAVAKRESYGVTVTTDNCAVARFAEILFLAVKPQFYESVIEEIKDREYYMCSEEAKERHIVDKIIGVDCELDEIL